MKKYNNNTMYNDMHCLFYNLLKTVSLSDYYFVVKQNSVFMPIYLIKYIYHLKKIYKLFHKYIHNINVPIYTLFYEIINIYKSFITTDVFANKRPTFNLNNFEFVFNYQYNSFNIILIRGIGIKKGYFRFNSDDNTISVSVEVCPPSCIYRFNIYPYDLENKLYDGIDMDCIKKKCISLLRKCFDDFIIHVLMVITESSMDKSKIHSRYKSVLTYILNKYIFKLPSY